MSENNVKTSKKKIGIIVIVAVLIIAIAGGILFFVLNNNSKSDDDTTTTAKTTNNITSTTEAKKDAPKMFVPVKYVYKYVDESTRIFKWENGKVTLEDSDNGTFEFTYNKKGNILRRLEIGGNRSDIICTPDKNGNIISEKTYYIDLLECEHTVADCEHRYLNCEHKYEYDSKGNVIKHTEYKEDNIKCTETKYDEKGNVIKSAYYNPDGTVLKSVEYEYDENGNEVKHFVHDEYGNFTYTHSYKYDEKGNKIKVMSYNVDGSLSATSCYEYDSRDNLIKEENFNEDNVLDDKHEYEYDEKNNKTKEIYTQRDAIDGTGEYFVETTVYEYDDKGNLIMEKSSGTPMSGTEIKYIYDGHGNLIKVEKYNDSELFLTQEYTWVETQDEDAFNFWKSEKISDLSLVFSECNHEANGFFY